ncbi:MAG: transcription antitermination factor NusB [Bacteroidales bacterium]|nr:transcription antitermination factor NusB [Bacteroidales bacterium]
MISRRLVRIKAVQTYYAFLQGNYDGSLEKVWEALELSIDKSYELFNELFCLIVAIADHAEYIIEFNKTKVLPTAEDLNPNRKFVDNRIIQAFRNNATIKKYMSGADSNWSEHYEFVRGIYNKMQQSEFFTNYMNDKNCSLKQDADLICKIINKFLVDNEELDDVLEGESIYWNDDVEFALSNLIQTIKKISDDNIDKFHIPSKYRNAEDETFAHQLIKCTCLGRAKFDEVIEANLQKWELQRIAFLDRVILHLALCEMTQFPELPVRVTINEYIDIAKGYSTEKSGNFINGILDKIYNQFKNDNTLNKIGMGLL